MATKDEFLKFQAEDLGIKGYSKMSKSELKKAIKKASKSQNKGYIKAN